MASAWAEMDIRRRVTLVQVLILMLNWLLTPFLYNMYKWN